MIKKMLVVLFAGVVMLFQAFPTYAHSGRTDSNGGHYDRSTGLYHYHNGGSSGSSDSSSGRKAPKYPSSISVKKPSGKILVGEDIQIDITVYPDDAENQEITWSSSNKKVATISSSGKITTVGAGKVSITATTANGKEDKIEIIIIGVLKDTSKTLAVGEAYYLKSSDITGSVKWSVSDDKIVTVDSEGKIAGKSVGEAVVYANYGGKTYACNVKVQKYRFKESISKTSVGDSVQLTPVIQVKDKKITWSSSDTSIATVDKNGLVSAKKAGIVKISCQIDSTIISRTLTVE